MASRALYVFLMQTTRAVEYTVFCRLAPLQKAIYRAIVREKMKVALETGRRDDALSSITMLKKLCNHPSLVYSMCQVCSSPAPRK
jgi:SNF2 family DNA or RNA helicase